MRSKKDENAEVDSIHGETIITFQQVIAGKLSFALTLGVFMWLVPGHRYLEFFGYTIGFMLIIGFLRSLGWINRSTNHYLVFIITGYASAMWMLAITQAFGK